MKTLLSMLMLLAMVVPAVACPCTGDDSPCVCTEECENCPQKTEGIVTEHDATMAEAKADPAYGVKYTEERIYKLPQDQGKPYITIVGKTGEKRFEALRTWFKENKQLVGLKAQAHYNVYPVGSPNANDLFGNEKTFPIVRVQNGKAQRLVELKGDEIPLSADALANAIASNTTKTEQLFGRFRNRGDSCPDGNCNRRGILRNRQDNKDDKAAPDEDPEPQPLDENDEPDQESAPLLQANGMFPWGLAIAAGVAAFLFGGWPEISKRWKKAMAPNN